MEETVEFNVIEYKTFEKWLDKEICLDYKTTLNWGCFSARVVVYSMNEEELKKANKFLDDKESLNGYPRRYNPENSLFELEYGFYVETKNQTFKFVPCDDEEEVVALSRTYIRHLDAFCLTFQNQRLPKDMEKTLKKISIGDYIGVKAIKETKEFETKEYTKYILSVFNVLDEYRTDFEIRG